MVSIRVSRYWTIGVKGLVILIPLLIGGEVAFASSDKPSCPIDGKKLIEMQNDVIKLCPESLSSEERKQKSCTKKERQAFQCELNQAEKKDRCETLPDKISESRKSLSDACGKARFGGNSLKSCNVQAKKCSELMVEFQTGTRVAPGHEDWDSESSDAEETREQCSMYGAQNLNRVEKDLEGVEENRNSYREKVEKLTNDFTDSQVKNQKSLSDIRNDIASVDEKLSLAQNSIDRAVSDLPDREQELFLKAKADKSQVDVLERENIQILTEKITSIRRGLRKAAEVCRLNYKTEKQSWLGQLKGKKVPASRVTSIKKNDIEYFKS